MRGTVEGLRRYLKIYAGVNAYISEPALNATVWSLGTNSTLGFTTMLAPASASGAILDSTAFLDGSDLTGPADPFGAALFDNVAYRFCVAINAGELTRPGALAAARAVIEREKPAHTVCELCIIQPRMRVGPPGQYQTVWTLGSSGVQTVTAHSTQSSLSVTFRATIEP